MLDYNSYVASILNLMPTTATDPGFITVLPNIIDDAEQRLYRELDLLNTVVRDSSAAFTPSTRTFDLPSTNGTFYVVEGMYAITPFGTTNPDTGKRNYLTPSSRGYIDAAFPSSAGSGIPAYFAPTTQNSYIVGPWPDQAYQAEVVGTIRPAAISTSNLTTLLSAYFPDLFVAASMVFAGGYMQNFGQQSDNAQMAVSWEAHYQALMQSAAVEEGRKKFTQAGWSGKQPAPYVTPPRT